MGVKIWFDINIGLVKLKKKNLSLRYGYGVILEGFRWRK